MGIVDPDRSFSGDSLEDSLAGNSGGLVEPTPRQTLARLWQAGSAIFPGTDWKSAIHRLGLVALALPHLKLIGRWLRCARNPALAAEMRSSHWAYRAIDRPYVNKDWRLPQRLQAMEQHYLALSEGGSLLNIAGTQYFDLLHLGPEYLDLRVVVDRPKWMRAEGEIAISLFYRDDRIYSAMFLIAGEPCSRRLVIGAFQGWGSAEAKETYVKLTRTLHGMRPRDLLVNVLKMVAANLGCGELWGIADACHRGKHMLVRCTKHASYDEVWMEHGGTPNGQGFFVMPADLRLKDAAEVPSKKRAQYRRRYELLGDMRLRIQRSFINCERRVEEHQPGAGFFRPIAPAATTEPG